MVQGMVNHIDRLGWVNAELKCDQEPSTMEIARVLASRCKVTVLTGSATPQGSSGSLGRGERANLAAQEQLRALRAQHSWMIRRHSLVFNRSQVQGDGRTALENRRDCQYDKELVQCGAVCLFRNHQVCAPVDTRSASWQKRDNRIILVPDPARTTAASSSWGDGIHENQCW